MWVRMRLVRLFCVLAVFAAFGGGGEIRADSIAPEELAAAPSDSAQTDSQTQRQSREELKQQMARIGDAEVPGVRQWERKKSPRVAMVCSMVLPGLGQLYNGRRYKTIIAAGAFTYYLGTAWIERKKSQEYLNEREGYPAGSIEWKNADLFYVFHKENAVTFLWWAGAVWLINVLDAYIDAHLYDVRSVTPSLSRGTDGTKYVALSFGF